MITGWVLDIAGYRSRFFVNEAEARDHQRVYQGCGYSTIVYAV